MQRRTMKIGIMGGTFNPIHNGHLIVAESVREKFGLDRVLFIPSGQPPHKSDSEVIEAEHRYEMVRLAVGSNRCFEPSRAEIGRDGYTYTVNTLEVLRKSYSPETGLFFIIGADVVNELPTWKDFHHVFELCEFIAVLRPGYDREAFEEAIQQMKEAYGLRVQIAEAPLVDISSSEIRRKCSMNLSIKYLVPETVEEYIRREGLYRKEMKLD